MRTSRLLALSVALVPGMLTLPTVTPPAAQAQPVPPAVQEVPLPSGVDAATLGSQGSPSDRALEAAASLDPAVDETAEREAALLTPALETEEFTAVGVTWDGETPAGTQVAVRVRAEGQWGPWEAVPVMDEGPDAGTEEAENARVGTAPLLTTGADAFQVRLDSQEGSAPEGVQAEVVDAGLSAADAQAVAPASADAAPTVISRRQWGADESLRKGSSSTMSQVKALVLHHTAGRNTYTPEQAYADIRSIYAYHTRSLGWSDIGYNFLVDRYGRVFEGRYGSLGGPVQGAHAGGFNAYTQGVAVMGNYDTAAVPAAVTTAVGNVTGWLSQRYGIKPKGTTQLTSAGGTSKYPAGTVRTLPTIFGHRDTGSTACPGRYLYPQLPAIREAAARGAGGGSAGGSPGAPAPAGPSAPVTRLAGPDRYLTSVSVGRQAAPSSSAAVLVSGATSSLIDGLVAAPLARAKGAPLLLTTPSSLPAAIEAELRRRGTRTVWVVGGESAVSRAVVTRLNSLGITVRRVAGANRYGTAAEVAKVLGAPAGRAIVASGRSMVDAAAAGGAGAAAHRPILLTEPGHLSPETAGALRALDLDSVHLVGSTAAVSSGVEQSIRSAGVAVYRQSGRDRYETAATLAQTFTQTTGATLVSVGSGEDRNVVDSLTAGSLGRLVVLTRHSTAPAPTTRFLSTVKPDRLYVVGSTGAISETAAAQLASASR